MHRSLTYLCHQAVPGANLAKYFQLPFVSHKQFDLGIVLPFPLDILYHRSKPERFCHLL